MWKDTKIIAKLFVLMVLLLLGCQPVSSTVPPPSTPATKFPSKTAVSPTSPIATSIPNPTIPVSHIELENTDLPPGFSLIRFAELNQPISFTFDSKGRMYVTSQDGNIYLLEDKDKNGRAESKKTFSSGYYFPLGVAVRDTTGMVYVSHRGKISILQDTNSDGIADVKNVLVSGLPIGTHQNNNLEFGPDGWLYLGVGSACKSCVDSDPRSATIMRFDPETGEEEIYARGLRNAFDIAFQPETGNLFATDNGRDDLGMDVPFEELNQIIQGGNYGYPGCWNNQDMPECNSTIPAVAFFEAHSSADGLDFYNGETFPAEYRDNAFVSIFGSWLKPGVQTGIQRVVMKPSGKTYKGEPSWFIRFPAGVMPLGVLFGPDDALYVGDYANNAIYRISYGIP